MNPYPRLQMSNEPSIDRHIFKHGSSMWKTLLFFKSIETKHEIDSAFEYIQTYDDYDYGEGEE